MEIEINGIKYQKQETTVPKSSGRLSSILLAAMAFGGTVGGNSYSRPNPKVDLVKEYELVLQKKSKLCKRDREWVEWAFKKTYKAVQ